MRLYYPVWFRLGRLRTTNPEVVEGAILRRSKRLHWTSQAAKEEVLEWMRERAETTPAGDIEWEGAEDVVIGRLPAIPIMLL